MATESTNPLRIAVVGGGIGGLAFAHLMKIKCPNVIITIYERDESPNARAQGYSIGLLPEAIERTLRPVAHQVPGLTKMLDDPRVIQRAFTTLDWKYRHLLSFKPTTTGSLVDRWGLRKCLTQNLDIRWNMRLVECIEREDGTGGNHIKLIFEDGTEETADFAVGADGANSRARRARLPDFVYEDTNVTFYAGSASLSSLKNPRMQSFVDGGLTRVLGRNGHSLLLLKYISHKNDDGTEDEVGSVRLLWALSHPGKRDDWRKLELGDLPDESTEMQGDDSANTAVVLQHAPPHLAKTEQERQQELSRAASQSYVERARKHFEGSLAETVIAETPFEHILGVMQYYSTNPAYLKCVAADISSGRRHDVGRIVLLGDAAHAMTSHRGLGANSALFDAADLCDAFVAIGNGSGVPYRDALHVYEGKMFTRGHVNVAASLSNTRLIHAMGWRACVRDWVAWCIGWAIVAYSNAPRLPWR
eukprot:Opistho-2@55985